MTSFRKQVSPPYLGASRLGRRGLALLVAGVVVVSAITGSVIVFKSRAAGTLTVNDSTTGTGPGQWEYAGAGWVHYTGSAAKFGGDDHSSSNAGDTATLRFSGTRVAYYGAKSPQAGIIAVSIDGGAETRIDLYSGLRQDNALIFTSPVLPAGSHSLRVRLTGERNPSATGAAAAVDRAVVTEGESSSTPLATDVNRDGIVNITDLSMLLSDWGRTSTPPPANPPPTPPMTQEPTTPPPPPPPAGGTTSPAPMPYPAKAVGLYHMMWSSSGAPKLSTAPANVNVINMSFAQNDPPSLTGWGSQGEASFIADARALRARGVRMVVSVGGAHGNVRIANRQAFVNGIMAINAKVPLDGLDWDIEGSTPMAPADVVWISKELKRLRGPNFAITMAPNGSNIDHYRAIAVELHNQGALDMIGQQFYDAVVSQSAMMGRLGQLRAAGIPENKIAIGMMVGSADIYWTVDECLSNINAAKQKYPNLRGGYLWESGRPGTADWANRAGGLLLR